MTDAPCVNLHRDYKPRVHGYMLCAECLSQFGDLTTTATRHEDDEPEEMEW